MTADDTKLDMLELAVGEHSWSARASALRTLTATLAAGEVSAERELALLPTIIAATSDEKWEVRKAAAVALSEFRYADASQVQSSLEALVQGQQTHYVKEAAERSLKRIRTRALRKREWKLADDARDPTLQHIMTRIREIGLSAMTPARIYELTMEVSEQSYREVAADTAHEMRNLLTPLEGYLVELRRRLLSDKLEPGDADEFVGLALTRLTRITRLIDDLTVYTDPTDADFMPLNLDHVVRQAVDIGADRGEAAAKREAAVTQVIDIASGIVIDAIEEKLVRAIANLVANAYQAMDAEGTLTIRAVTATDRVRVSVIDTGRGMRPQDVEKARKRFKSTRRNQGGTGLGLPIAERIIADDHRGELEIHSAIGEGTTITLTLPLRQRTERK